MNRTLGPNKRLLFDYSAQPPAPLPAESTSTPGTPSGNSTEDPLPSYNPLSKPNSKQQTTKPSVTPITELEGANDDPSFTKVVDRRWYERNKHIFPASVWQEFDPAKDYQKEVKRDVGGNTFFFS